MLLSGIRVPQSVFYCVVFRQRLFFSLCHSIACPSIYGFWLPILVSSNFSGMILCVSVIYVIPYKCIYYLCVTTYRRVFVFINYTIHKCVSVIPLEQARSVYNVYICHHCFIIDRYYLSYTGIQSNQY